MKVGVEMKKAVSGLRLVHDSRKAVMNELREATTGRPVSVARSLVPRIWAVASPVEAVAEAAAAKPEPKAELAFYRKYSEALLGRYQRMSVEVGRVPSVMGREMFRGAASSYRMRTFEDGIVFCIDVERCLAKLRKQDLQVVRRVALQGYTQAETAPMLGVSLKTCVQRYGQAIDRLTELFLAGRLLEPQKCCQEGDAVENSLSS